MAKSKRALKTRVPRRLYTTVPIDALAACLVEAGVDGERLFERKRDARSRRHDRTALVTVFPREAERDGVTFEKTADGWSANGRVEARHLGCRDDKALRELRVKRKESAGGLIVSSESEARVMLLFRRHGDTTSWKTPKGGIQDGESLEEAARREVLEESGLSRVRVLGYLGRMQYFKPHPKRPMSEKTVHLYLMLSEDGEVGIAPREGERFVSNEWLPVDEAINRVTQPQARRLIARAGRRLGQR